jgi:hypothetical protein
MTLLKVRDTHRPNPTDRHTTSWRNPIFFPQKTDGAGFADIKNLTISNPTLVSKLGPAFEKYNEEQFMTVKLPGGSQQVRESKEKLDTAEGVLASRREEVR